MTTLSFFAHFLLQNYSMALINFNIKYCTHDFINRFWPGMYNRYVVAYLSMKAAEDQFIQIYADNKGLEKEISALTDVSNNVNICSILY